MAIIDIIKRIFCSNQDIIDGYKVKIAEYEEQLTKAHNKILKLGHEKRINEEAEYWNNKWKKADIKYKFQGEYYRDARSLINYPSYLATKTVQKYNLKKDSEAETILSILKFCDKKIPYSFDINNWGTREMWEDSDIILQKMRDDCDGKAIVFKALSLACGIPDYKVKVCAGWVKNPKNKKEKVGHAYPIFLLDNKWYVVDPTYYPDYTDFMKRKTHKEDKNYYPIDKPIWWTFTKEFCFAQEDIEI